MMSQTDNDNQWTNDIENILDKIIPGKESVHCGINEEGIIKAFDIYVKTGKTTSRLKASASDT